MGLKDVIQTAVVSAFTAVDDLAETIPYHSIGIVDYDPNAGTNIEKGGYDYEIDAIKLEFEADKIDNEIILPTDYRILLKGKDIEFTPKPEDTLEIDNVVYRVLNQTADPAKATWDLHVRPFYEDSISTIQ